MIINYPDGRKAVLEKKDQKVDRRKTANRTEAERAHDKYIKSNMGMVFESEISKTCDFYREKNLADLYKRPTPIKVVKMSKTHPGMICEAYFQEKSTTDYVGIYKGKYIDFECKETIHDSIPYHMIREQQYDHLRFVQSLGGIGFFLVSFKAKAEVYLLRADIVLKKVDEKHHPGFSYQFFKDNAVLVKRGYNPSYYLLDAIDEAFRKEINLE
ncbi:MAG: Holliday junction resolvase RecU [Bacilli bacterium]